MPISLYSCNKRCIRFALVFFLFIYLLISDADIAIPSIAQQSQEHSANPKTQRSTQINQLNLPSLVARVFLSTVSTSI